MNDLGRLLQEGREALARIRQREVRIQDVADELKARGVDIERRTYGHLEEGNRKSIKPEVANELARLFPTVSIAQIVKALGYELEFEGIEDETEVELLRLYRLVGRPYNQTALGALRELLLQQEGKGQ